MPILVTGAAGFIGFHLCLRLLKNHHEVVGVDNLNDYYDIALKKARLALLESHSGFRFYKVDIANAEALTSVFEHHDITEVVNLAAQAGVRYSIENPDSYIDANVTGFLNILKASTAHQVKHVVYASSSSVYGANTKQPLTETDHTDHPLAIYPASKKMNELMAHAYASLYQLPCTGLRYFTVYGPWGRPDMALFKFTKAILASEPIDVYNNGEMVRDFTYVDDIVEGTIRALKHPAQPDPNWNSDTPNPAASYAPYRIYNIGNGNPTPLMDYIKALEEALGKKATLNMMPMQQGDIPTTAADTKLLEHDLGYKPAINVTEGVKRFVEWYQDYFSDNTN